MALQAFDGDELHDDDFVEDDDGVDDLELQEDDLLPPLEDEPLDDDAALALPTNANNDRHSPAILNVFIFQP